MSVTSQQQVLTVSSQALLTGQETQTWKCQKPQQMADVQKIRMVLTSQHICGDEPLEGFDLELDRVGEGGGGEEQRGGHLHSGDLRHSA